MTDKYTLGTDGLQRNEIIKDNIENKTLKLTEIVKLLNTLTNENNELRTEDTRLSRIISETKTENAKLSRKTQSLKNTIFSLKEVIDDLMELI